MPDKTTKQMADELGLDKQKVYRYIKRNHITEAHQNNGVMYYDEAAQTIIKQGLLQETASSEVHHEAHQKHINDTVNEADILTVLQATITTLETQLEIKDRQITDLTAVIKSQAQSINADRHAELAEKMSTGQIEGSADPKDPDITPPKKKGFFSLFKRH